MKTKELFESLNGIFIIEESFKDFRRVWDNFVKGWAIIVKQDGEVAEVQNQTNNLGDPTRNGNLEEFIEQLEESGVDINELIDSLPFKLVPEKPDL